MKIFSVPLALLSVFTLFSDYAQATRIPAMSPQQLANDSAAIVIGTVTAIGYEYSKSGEPLTTVRLQRLETVAGKEQLGAYLERGLTLSLAGGLTREGSMVEIDGLPRLELGQTYLLFLRGGDWTMSPFAGWSQGVMHVLRGLDGKGRLATYDGRFVTDIQPDRLITAPAARPPEAVKATSAEVQRGEFKISERPPESSSKAAQKSSLYREDNEKELLERDAKQALAASKELGADNREWLKQAEIAMPLDRAVAVLQSLHAKSGKVAQRPLKLEPSVTPADSSQQPAAPDKKR